MRVSIYVGEGRCECAGVCGGCEGVYCDRCECAGVGVGVRVCIFVVVGGCFN